MEFRTVIYEAKEQIGWITLNRPEAMNAINQEMSREIVSVCREVEEDENIRVVIFRGAGDKAFSAGADLKERAQGVSASVVERRHAKTSPGIRTPNQAISAITKPTIAAIGGYAMGGGLELALACDIRIACEGSRLGLPEVRRGMIPGAGGTQRLVRLIGIAKALEICLAGEPVEAREAYRVGLVSSVVPAAELVPAAERLARSILKGAPLSLRYVKEAIYKGVELPLEEGLRLEADLSALIATTEDNKEGPRAFAEKRDPVWKGR